MKKIIAITLLLASVLTVFSCREKSYDVAVPQLITVSSGADIAFKAIGGEGDIEVNATSGQLQVTTDQADWCHLTLNGNKIHVVTDANDGLESRYAVLNMQAGEATGKTIVHQYGIIVRSLTVEDKNVNNKEQDIVFPYDANESVIVATTDVNWLTISIDKETLKLHVAENAEKDFREALVNWSIGQMKGEFSVIQFDALDAGLLGDWTWTVINAANNRSMTMNATLSENIEELVLGLKYSTAGDWSTPVIINGKEIKIPLGEDIGQYKTSSKTYHTFPLMAAGSAAIQYANAVSTGYFNLSLSKDETTGKWKAVGNFDEYPGMNFRLEFFESAEHTGTSGSRLAMKSITATQK